MTNTRASNLEVRKFSTLLKATQKAARKPFSSISYKKSYGEQRQDPGRECRNLQ